MGRRVERLEPAAVEAALAALPGWALADGKLHRVFHFADFGEAFGFMARCAALAERMDHHPEWSNVYRKVVVDLVTHDCGGVSEKDVAMAREMSAFAGPQRV